MPGNERPFVLIELDQVIVGKHKTGHGFDPGALVARAIDDHARARTGGRNDGRQWNAVVGIVADIDDLDAMPCQILSREVAEHTGRAQRGRQRDVPAEKSENHGGVQCRAARKHIVSQCLDLAVGVRKHLDQRGDVDHRPSDEKRPAHHAATRGSSAPSE